MNRIRYHNEKYQVLITPYRMGDDGIEIMLGNWTDDHLRNYKVQEFDDKEDALECAINLPELNFNRIVDFHKDIYIDLYRAIKDDLDDHNFVYDLDPKIMSPEQLKNSFFDRVINLGSRFSLTYNLNDVIGYNIINPYSKNLREIYKVLKYNNKLRIVRHESKNGIIRMIGETDIGTNYEIVLWPSLVAYWAKWSSQNSDVSKENKTNALKDVIRLQKKVDETINIR